MVKKQWISMFILLVILLEVGACATASDVQDDKDPLEVTLYTLRKEPIVLTDIVSKHDATLLIWYGTTCPCVVRYQKRMHDLRVAFEPEKVAVYAISSNADDDFTSLQKTKTERGFILPILLDVDGTLARLLGARSTPTVVVLDAQGSMRFRGWIDNERLPGTAGRIAYAENAIREVLDEAKEHQTRHHGLKRSPVFGCRITQTLRETAQCRSVSAATK